jgi:hypothetical protein
MLISNQMLLFETVRSCLYFTVTLQDAVLPLKSVILTVAVPLLTALTVALLPPFFVTVATLLLLLVHLRLAALA